MREFKFRVWSPANNKMYFSSERPFNSYWDQEDRHNSARCNKESERAFGVVQRNYTVNDLGKLSYTDALEDDYTDRVMQWTGLRDKHNRDIYEGDIIRISWTQPKFKTLFIDNYDREDKEQICQIIFHNAKFTCLPYCSLHDFCHINKNSEVIGNIHENPSLLKQHEE